PPERRSPPAAPEHHQSSRGARLGASHQPRGRPRAHGALLPKRAPRRPDLSGALVAVSGSEGVDGESVSPQRPRPPQKTSRRLGGESPPSPRLHEGRDRTGTRSRPCLPCLRLREDRPSPSTRESR